MPVALAQPISTMVAACAANQHDGGRWQQPINTMVAAGSSQANTMVAAVQLKKAGSHLRIPKGHWRVRF
jgi:hypothetical protein